MTPRKKRVGKRGAYAQTRPRAGAPRRDYIVSNVTAEEKRAIVEHCHRRRTSVSAFLAELILREVREAPNVPEQNEELTVTLRLSRQEYEKLNMLSRSQQKSVADLLHEGLKPSLNKRKAHSPVEWDTVRCWLSKREHQAIKKYLKSRRLSARTYLSYLALKAIKRSEK